MKKYRLFKYLRIVAALSFGAAFSWALFDTAQREMMAGLFKTQFFPDLLAGIAGGATVALVLLLFWIIVTCLFGRIFCSTLCPLGILQEILAATTHLFRRYKEEKNHRTIRYIFFGAVTVFAFFGFIAPLAAVEPFSFFVRLANNLGEPLIFEINRYLIREWHWEINPMPLRPFSQGAFYWSLASFIALLALVAWKGRIYCTTICPAGTLLGLMSKGNLLGLRIAEDKCIKCRKCVGECPSGCITIDKETQTIDAERCIDCLSCAAICPVSAIGFKRRRFRKKTVATDDSRRSFIATMLIGGTAIAVATPFLKMFGRRKNSMILPPGAISQERFLGKCTGCLACVRHCTGNVLRPSFGEHGLSNLFAPHVSFDDGMCEYDCTNCNNVCPTGALRPLTLADKRLCRIGMVQYHQERCVVQVDKVDCGACGEHCPTGAIEMVDFEDNLRIPKIVPELCIGCGSCQYICPVYPEKAIQVHGLEVQEKARLLTKQPAAAVQEEEKKHEEAFPF